MNGPALFKSVLFKDQLQLTFQVLKNHMWLVAALLDSTGLD